MKAVIMAGGKGSRISASFPDIPKPLIPIGGKPVLEHTIDRLKEYGIDDIIITVSYKAPMITEYFGDGSRFGVRIVYYVEEKPLGNAGALFKIRDSLTDDFFLLNSDSMFDVDLDRFYRYHAEKKALVTLFTHPNSHPYDSSVIVEDNNGAVAAWITKEKKGTGWYRNLVNAGIEIMSPDALDLIDTEKAVSEEPRIDLDRDIILPLTRSGRVFSYKSPEYVKDMGTPERYAEVSSDYESGIIKRKNLKNRQRAVFLDRDGTLNRYVGFVRDPDEFELLDGVCEAISKINRSGYLAVLVTNQPAIARGEITYRELDSIHGKMDSLLSEKGAYLDAVYFCPHHPDRGFDGEIPELKIECTCRKPKPGMLIRAAEDLNIDLASSWMIGDRQTDIAAGKAAGCKTALIGCGDFTQDVSVGSLSEFADSVLFAI
ncbi:MAG: HAD-IIIA family hydrolase [Clostridia bacterium]|nr:HAD-IIIA family hydrolase [Clostridia bacterium]